MKFGAYIRKRREAKAAQGTPLSLTAFAAQIGIDKGYLSKIEQEKLLPPSEALIVKIAEALDEDPDYLLALAGKVASDVVDAIVRSEGKFSRVIREALKPTDAQAETGPPLRKKRLIRKTAASPANKGADDFASWKTRDPDDEPALPHAAVLEIQEKYGFSDIVTDKLWTDIECAVLTGIREEPKGEAERSKVKANVVLQTFQSEVSFALECLKDASERLAEIYFIDPEARAAEDNRYLSFSAQLGSIRLDLVHLEKGLIDLQETGVVPILNGFANESYRSDFRRERISAAVFEAMVESGNRLTWTYSPDTERRENAAISLINEIAGHLVEPFHEFSSSTLHADWKKWISAQAGGKSSKV